MKRKRRDRTKPRHDPGKAAAAGQARRAPTPDRQVPPEQPSGPRPAKRPSATRRLSVRLLLVFEILVFVLLSLACLVLHLLRTTGPLAAHPWPAAQQLGLPLNVVLAGAGLQVLSGLVLLAARRAARSNKRGWVRVCLAGTIVLGLAVCGLRVVEYASLHALGISVWDIRGSVSDRADLHYVHAVRTKLKQHLEALEDKRANRPDLFDTRDQERLELVTELQTNLVSWTEQEIGHWLDDLQQRQSLIDLIAYHVHPREADHAAMVSRIALERQSMQRTERWFDVLEAYCRQKEEYLPRAKPSERKESGALLSDSSGANADDPQRSETILSDQAREAALQRLDQEAAEQLKAAGADQWPFAKAVLGDRDDVAMTSERVNQIKLQRESIAGRKVFLERYLDPLVTQQDAVGLNAAHRWLQLPVSFPNVRSWTGCYFLLTIMHFVMLALGLLGVTLPLLSGRDRWPTGSMLDAAPLWQAAVVAGVFLSTMCFIL